MIFLGSVGERELEIENARVEEDEKPRASLRKPQNRRLTGAEASERIALWCFGIVAQLVKESVNDDCILLLLCLCERGRYRCDVLC